MGGMGSRGTEKERMKKTKSNIENVFDDEPPLPAPLPESELTQGLDDEQKLEFARLLKEKMSLEERADLLIELAHKKCTKTAAVGLRAIQEINKITGVSNDSREETSPMFVLPPDSAVAIMVKKPKE